MEASEENPRRAKLRSLLETLGSELIAILAPVSACMFLVVLLVRTLSTTASASNPSPAFATFAYAEDPSDSFAHRLQGALLNALAFVAFITIATFTMVAFFYFRCNRCLRIYLYVSVFNLLVYFGSITAIQLIEALSIPVDAITFTILVANFGVVGVLVTFPWMPVPIVFTQGYLVLIAMLAAFWFTSLPEWTTWALLLGLAAYDAAAVLLPGGPLNLLIQIAMKREEELPALVYECRPAVNENDNQHQQQQMRRWRRREAAASDAAPASPSSLFSRIFSSGATYQSLSNSGETTVEVVSRETPRGTADEEDESESVSAPLMESRPEIVSSLIGNESRAAGVIQEELSLELHESSGDEESGGRVESTLEGGLKLGLGDFIFYSVLVGRAAMFDLMTVGACYLAIVAGLGVTLLLLAVWRRALPALPVSISLGVLFYFVTRLVVEPLVLQLDTSLVFF